MASHLTIPVSLIPRWWPMRAVGWTIAVAYRVLLRRDIPKWAVRLIYRIRVGR